MHFLPVELAGIVGDYDCRYKLRGKLDWPLLNMWELSKNPHPAAVEYLLSHKENIAWKMAGHNTNNEMVQEMLLTHPTMITQDNSNDLATLHILAHLGHVVGVNLSQNSNELAIEYMMSHQDRICWPWFVRHADERVGKLAIDNWQRIRLCDAVQSSNDMILAKALDECERLLEHTARPRGRDDYLTIAYLWPNSHPHAVEWLLAHPLSIMDSAFENADDRIVDLALKTFDLIEGCNSRSKNQKVVDAVCESYGPTNLIEREIVANPLIFAEDMIHRQFIIDAS